MSLYSNDFSIKDLYSVWQYKRQFRKEHPEYFPHDGITIFENDQGQGKTYSAVVTVYKLLQKYPQCKLVTNVDLRDYPIVTMDEFYNNDKNNKLLMEWTFNDNLTSKELKNKKEKYYIEHNRIFPFCSLSDYSKYNNDYAGVIFFVDEITMYVNCKDSSATDIDWIVQMSTQRKQRKFSIFTTQVFGELEITVRRKFKTVIHCRNLFGCIQINDEVRRVDIKGDKNGTNIVSEKARRHVFTHNVDIYKSYNTSAMVEYHANREEMNKKWKYTKVR